ncbi:MAG: PhzF family phenazine biosynthesis protein [Porticoccaceae bacterium]|nr:PhzF family phenazine biosynthesis protein [Porticoccaceae bacterium]
MTKYKFYTADVFTNQIFQGAQIAVFPEAEQLSDTQMSLIGAELNLSETVFVAKQVSKEEPDNKFRLRIFTPKGEIDFAGHPILATARALLEAGRLDISSGNSSSKSALNTSLIFQQNTGDINVNVTHEADKPLFVQFSLTASPVIDHYTPTESELARLLCIDESDIDTHTFHTRLASIDLPYLVVPLTSQQAVRKARFSLDAWSQSSAPAMAAQEIFIFSSKTDNRDTDFHGRLLGPGIGANEDPPIGSAMPCFAGYLGEHEHIREGTYTFTIDRGTAEARRSVLHIEMDYHKDKPTKLRVGGEVILVSENTLLMGD